MFKLNKFYSVKKMRKKVIKNLLIFQGDKIEIYRMLSIDIGKLIPETYFIYKIISKKQ